MASDESNREVSRSTANGDDCQKSAQRIISCTCSRENQGGRRGQRNRRGSNQCSRAPMLKQLQKLCELAVLEFLVQVCRTGRSCHAESQICTHNRSSGSCSGIFRPQGALTGREYSREDIRTAKCRNVRAI